MILMLDTSTPICRVVLIDDDKRSAYEWQADRDLARGLLSYLTTVLGQNNAEWRDVTALAVFKGPGSFTGLRIGLTVMNTVASTLRIPIVGATGETWIDVALDRLRRGIDDHIAMPEYGADARITQPRK